MLFDSFKEFLSVVLHQVLVTLVDVCLCLFFIVGSYGSLLNRKLSGVIGFLEYNEAVEVDDHSSMVAVCEPVERGVTERSDHWYDRGGAKYGINSL